MGKPLAIASLASACILSGVARLDGGQPLSLRVSPSVSCEPAFLHVEVRLEADDQNRSLEIVAESPDYFRSSRITLDGSKAPRLAVFEFRSLPSGVYEVTGILGGVNGRRAAVSRIFNVVPSAASSR
jgi:hypothetical protein